MESTKNSDIRANNRKRIVNALFRQGQMTKQELAQRLNISLPTANLLLKELADKGLVTNGKVMDSTGGRKPVCIMPVYDAKFSIGAEVSSHGLRIILLDLGSNIIAREYFPYNLENTPEYWKKVNAAVMAFAAKHMQRPDMLLDMGITLEAPMQDGRIIPKKTMTETDQVDLDMAASCFDVPVKFRNSIKMEATAQTWALDRWENFVFVSLGAHVNGAIVYNGAVLEFSNINGEFGSIIIGKNQPYGKIEDYYTTGALCQRAGVDHIQAFFERIDQGDEGCAALWKTYLEGLAVFFHNLYCIFGWKIVAGGRMSPYLEPYKDALNQRLRDMDDYCQTTDTYLEISSLGEYGAAVGAAMLPVDEFLEFGYDRL